ncbi:MAG: hypothetical protein JWO13_504 [Acidobacteriales bacterium]|nr:hypothetical protein [Terriglobales bacterium]
MNNASRAIILGYFLLASILLAAQQTAQVDPSAIVHADSEQRALWAAEWVNSQDPVRLAWGAWLARRDTQRTLLPELVRKLSEYSPQDPSVLDRDRHDAMLAVLDAIIEMQAAVSTEDARKLYPEFPAQAVILLVRSPHSQSALLQIFNEAKANWTWLAAGNVLAKSRPPGFAALLMGSFTQHLTISVFDHGMGGGIGGASSCCGGGSLPKSGWPQVGLYYLTQFPERMGLPVTFLVGGKTPVYFGRLEHGNYDNPSDIPDACNDGNRDDYRAEYLNQFLQSPSQSINLSAYPTTSIAWRSEAMFKSDLIAAVKDEQAKFLRVTSLLREKGLLTSAEAEGLQPKIEVVIQDYRNNRTAPIPTFTDNENALAVKSAFTKPLP